MAQHPEPSSHRPSPQAPLPRRPVWRRNPLRRPAPAEDWEQELHRRHPPPPVAPPVTGHRPNYSHNPPAVDPLMMAYRRLVMLESCQPEYDRFAFLPAAGWAGFTLIGCLWNGYFFSGAVVLLGIGAFGLMVFGTRGSLRWQNVAIGLTACLFGILLLGGVGEVGVFNLGRVLGWLISLFPHSHRRHSAFGGYDDVTYSAPTPAALPAWYDFLLSIPTLALIGLSVYCGFILYQYLGMHREICQLRDRLQDEVGR